MAGAYRRPPFISHRRLSRQRALPRAVGRWALDPGGFTELSMHGRWHTAPTAYAAATRRYGDEVGGLDWAAPQDWMCEPFMLGKTGLTVAGHQVCTVESVLELRSIDPTVPWVPVLQGWELADYLRCVELYDDAGIDLRAEPTVGVGSICRRQSEAEVEVICAALAAEGIRLHGFGVKTLGLRYARHLRSADSMAWSYNARRSPAIPGHSHKSCANCITWALRWRDRVIRRAGAQQFGLFDATPHHVCQESMDTWAREAHTQVMSKAHRTATRKDSHMRYVSLFVADDGTCCADLRDPDSDDGAPDRTVTLYGSELARFAATDNLDDLDDLAEVCSLDNVWLRPVDEAGGVQPLRLDDNGRPAPSGGYVRNFEVVPVEADDFDVAVAAHREDHPPLPYVYFDDMNDPYDPRWVLRYEDRIGQVVDDVLSADDPDNWGEAVAEAAASLARRS